MDINIHCHIEKMIGREIHPDFQLFLDLKDGALINLYNEVRKTILAAHPEANEILYHTHALTSVYTVSEKLSTGYCHIPIYTAHLNLGFNKGALLKDPDGLLKGTGKLIRHIPISDSAQLQNANILSLITQAVRFAIDDMDKPTTTMGKTFSKINV